MMCVSDATEAELRAASREYVRLLGRDGRGGRAAAVRSRLRAAIIAHKADGAKVSDIEDIAPYRRGRITTILEAAGLTEKRTPRSGS
jgi:hypothetical protein